MSTKISKHFVRYLKWRDENLCKLYGYGLCKGKPAPPPPETNSKRNPQQIGLKRPKRKGSSHNFSKEGNLDLLFFPPGVKKKR